MGLPITTTQLHKVTSKKTNGACVAIKEEITLCSCNESNRTLYYNQKPKKKTKVKEKSDFTYKIVNKIVISGGII